MDNKNQNIDVFAKFFRNEAQYVVLCSFSVKSE